MSISSPIVSGFARCTIIYCKGETREKRRIHKISSFLEYVKPYPASVLGVGARAGVQECDVSLAPGPGPGGQALPRGFEAERKQRRHLKPSLTVKKSAEIIEATYTNKAGKT